MGNLFMKKKPEELVAQWFRKAEKDLKTVSHEFTFEEPESRNLIQLYC